MESLRVGSRLRAHGSDVRRLGEKMFDYLVSGLVAALVLVYLAWAMFQPERF